MEWFIIAARLICHICKVNNYSYLVNNSKVTSFTGFSRMGLIAEVHFYRPAFLFNLPTLLGVGDFINRCGLMPISYLFCITCQSRQTTVVSQATWG